MAENCAPKGKAQSFFVHLEKARIIALGGGQLW